MASTWELLALFLKTGIKNDLIWNDTIFKYWIHVISCYTQNRIVENSGQMCFSLSITWARLLPWWPWWWWMDEMINGDKMFFEYFNKLMNIGGAYCFLFKFHSHNRDFSEICNEYITIHYQCIWSIAENNIDIRWDSHYVILVGHFIVVIFQGITILEDAIYGRYHQSNLLSTNKLITPNC